MGHLSELDAADSEESNVASGSTADRTAIVFPDLEFLRPFSLDFQTLLCHGSPAVAEPVCRRLRRDSVSGRTNFRPTMIKKEPKAGT